ncbi:MAG TPA: hypothetical protein VNF91_01640 [Candidatus Acidoferrum sp.]|nr:hypothetical protein [Candidatus Acidoferrum sp.]
MLSRLLFVICISLLLVHIIHPAATSRQDAPPADPDAATSAP